MDVTPMDIVIKGYTGHIDGKQQPPLPPLMGVLSPQGYLFSLIPVVSVLLLQGLCSQPLSSRSSSSPGRCLSG